MKLEKILNIVCDYFGYSPELVKSKSRKRQYVIVRAYFYYFACKRFGKTYKEAAQFVNRKDHTSVVNAFITIEQTPGFIWAIMELSKIFDWEKE